MSHRAAPHWPAQLLTRRDILIERHFTPFEGDQVRHIYYVLYGTAFHLTRTMINMWRWCSIQTACYTVWTRYIKIRSWPSIFLCKYLIDTWQISHTQTCSTKFLINPTFIYKFQVFYFPLVLNYPERCTFSVLHDHNFERKAKFLIERKPISVILHPSLVPTMDVHHTSLGLRIVQISSPIFTFHNVRPIVLTFSFSTILKIHFPNFAFFFFLCARTLMYINFRQVEEIHQKRAIMFSYQQIFSLSACSLTKNINLGWQL